MSELGRIAYVAYADKRNWKTYNGTAMPEFKAQEPGLQEAWDAAAEAVVRRVIRSLVRDVEGYDAGTEKVWRDASAAGMQ